MLVQFVSRSDCERVLAWVDSARIQSQTKMDVPGFNSAWVDSCSQMEGAEVTHLVVKPVFRTLNGKTTAETA